MTPTKTIKSALLAAAGALVVTTIVAAFQPVDAGPVLRGRVKGAIARCRGWCGIVGDPAAGARIGRAVGTVSGIKDRRDRRRSRVTRRARRRRVGAESQVASAHFLDQTIHNNNAIPAARSGRRQINRTQIRKQ